MIYNTIGGPVKIIYPSQIIDIIPTEQIQNSRSYHFIKSLSAPSSLAHNLPATSSFTTQTNGIVNFGDKEDLLISSLVKELDDRVLTTVDAVSWENALADASVDCLENFGAPTHAILFENNVMIMGEFTHDNICFKEVTPNTGTLVMYSPHKFNICKMPGPAPYVGPANSKYNKYVQHIMILETLKKLDLV